MADEFDLVDGLQALLENTNKMLQSLQRVAITMDHQQSLLLQIGDSISDLIESDAQLLTDQSDVVAPLIPNPSTPSIIYYDTSDAAGEIDSHGDLAAIDDSLKLVEVIVDVKKSQIIGLANVDDDEEAEESLVTDATQLNMDDNFDAIKDVASRRPHISLSRTFVPVIPPHLPFLCSARRISGPYSSVEVKFQGDNILSTSLLSQLVITSVLDPNFVQESPRNSSFLAVCIPNFKISSPATVMVSPFGVELREPAIPNTETLVAMSSSIRLFPPVGMVYGDTKANTLVLQFQVRDRRLCWKGGTTDLSTFNVVNWHDQFQLDQGLNNPKSLIPLFNVVFAYTVLVPISISSEFVMLSMSPLQAQKHLVRNQMVIECLLPVLYAPVDPIMLVDTGQIPKAYSMFDAMFERHFTWGYPIVSGYMRSLNGITKLCKWFSISPETPIVLYASMIISYIHTMRFDDGFAFCPHMTCESALNLLLNILTEDIAGCLQTAISKEVLPIHTFVIILGFTFISVYTSVEVSYTSRLDGFCNLRDILIATEQFGKILISIVYMVDLAQHAVRQVARTGSLTVEELPVIERVPLRFLRVPSWGKRVFLSSPTDTSFLFHNNTSTSALPDLCQSVGEIYIYVVINQAHSLLSNDILKPIASSRDAMFTNEKWLGLGSKIQTDSRLGGSRYSLRRTISPEQVWTVESPDRRRRALIASED